MTFVTVTFMTMFVMSVSTLIKPGRYSQTGDDYGGYKNFGEIHDSV
jgi:hypothetical protein